MILLYAIAMALLVYAGGFYSLIYSGSLAVSYSVVLATIYIGMKIYSSQNSCGEIQSSSRRM